MKEGKEIKISQKEQERLGQEIAKVMKKYKYKKVALYVFLIFLAIALTLLFVKIGKLYNRDFICGQLCIITDSIISLSLIKDYLKSKHNELDEIINSSEEITEKIKEEIEKITEVK